MNNPKKLSLLEIEEFLDKKNVKYELKNSVILIPSTHLEISLGKVPGSIIISQIISGVKIEKSRNINLIPLEIILSSIIPNIK